MNKTYLYPYSAEEARRRNEMSLWRASHKANLACKEEIELAIGTHFDGTHLEEGCAEGVIREYGYKRVQWVLSHTIQQLDWSDRFSQANKEWARQTYIPKDRAYVTDLIIVSDPAVVDLFATQFQCAYQELGLFGPNQCEPNSFEKLDYEGKVLVLSTDTLKESYWTTRAQLWYAHDGFGCSPKAIGRSIRCTCLGDGEMTRWNRTDFIGVLKDEFLPEWAKEKLMELKGQEQNNDSPAMGGMTME